MEYDDFIESKRHAGAAEGFAPHIIPDHLFDFQADLVDWAVRQGRAAIFADCGLGKTPMQLAWAQNVAHETGLPVLILTPLAVAAQTVREGERFGVPTARSHDGAWAGSPVAVVTNYERLHHFDPSYFGGVVCDESSILKSFNGVRRGEITRFMRKVRYRLLCTATAAPNDWVELGTSSEALGYLGHMDMIGRFFVNDRNNASTGRMHGKAAKWRLRGHAVDAFWRWTCSWARAVRRPSDLVGPNGERYDDGRFTLPALTEREHVVEARTLPPGELFPVLAGTLHEQRAERRRTIGERCEKVAALVDHAAPALVWCDLNDEADLLEKLIPGAIQVAGADSDEAKEEKLLAFADGEARALVTKPSIGAWGLNFQHCAHVTFFPSHSFEQYYQGVRRCWRFGQTRPVTVDLVTTEGAARVLDNLQRKQAAADEMFGRLVEHMNDALSVDRERSYPTPAEVPSWLGVPAL